MSDWRVIRVGLALAAIFALGVVTGRVTAPRRPAGVPPVRGPVVSADDFMSRLLNEVTLDADQQSVLRPILERMMEEAHGTQPGTRERLAILDRHEPEIRRVMRPEQLPAYLRALERSRSRIDRFATMRERRAGGARTNTP